MHAYSIIYPARNQKYIPYSQKFLQYVYFAIKSLIRIFAENISWMAYNEASFQLNMMLSSEFLRTKLLLLINHLRKPRKFPACGKTDMFVCIFQGVKAISPIHAQDH